MRVRVVVDEEVHGGTNRGGAGWIVPRALLREWVEVIMRLGIIVPVSHPIARSRALFRFRSLPREGHRHCVHRRLSLNHGDHKDPFQLDGGLSENTDQNLEEFELPLVVP